MDNYQNGLILSMWQCDPEFRIIEALNKFLPMTGLDERGIKTKSLVTYGHPVYTFAQNNSSDYGKNNEGDNFFPKIGVEWENDENADDLGGNTDYFGFDSRIKNKIQAYMERENKKDSEYENISYALYKKSLESRAFKQVESVTGHIVSNVMISGWSGPLGSSARKSAQDIYKGVDAVLPFIKTDLHKRFKVTVLLNGSPQLNIEAPQIGRGAFGFEVKLQVRQIRRIFMLSEEPLIRKADVSLSDRSKSNLSGLKGFGTNPALI